MNFKKYYINGHSHIDIKLGSFKINVLPHMEWNDLMLLLTKVTTKPFVIDKQYHVVEYPYTPGVVEKIESWYGREWIFGKKSQYTKSTFIEK